MEMMVEDGKSWVGIVDHIPVARMVLRGGKLAGGIKINLIVITS
jgi:hypothetical protein